MNGKISRALPYFTDSIGIFQNLQKQIINKNYPNGIVDSRTLALNLCGPIWSSPHF